jgi:hypothetical protein
MDEPTHNAAQRIVDAVESLRAALGEASPPDRCMGIIVSVDSLTAIYQRVASDYALFDRAFPPQPVPRFLVG